MKHKAGDLLVANRTFDKIRNIHVFAAVMNSSLHTLKVCFSTNNIHHQSFTAQLYEQFFISYGLDWLNNFVCKFEFQTKEV